MEIKNIIRSYIIENILFGNEEIFDSDTSLHENRILDSIGFLGIITFVEEHFDTKV